jgi:hypothetical protein
MKVHWTIGLAVLAAALFVAAPAAAMRTGASGSASAEFIGFSTGFELQGTNGYDIRVGAYTERLDSHGRIGVGVTRGNSSGGGGAFYSAPAIVSEQFIKADLGPFGRVDLALNLSGETKKIDIRCSDQSYVFEPGVYEGAVEFTGERGYTTVSATRVPLHPPITSFCGSGRGSGESRGSGLPGARLLGVSYAHGRYLTFQVNKNHRRRGRVPYSVRLREKRGNVKIGREIAGIAPAASFHFDQTLRTADLHLPPPFSGSADLSRRPNSVSPSWTGDLAVDFPGRPDVRLAGPTVHVSLVPACFTHSSGGVAESC